MNKKCFYSTAPDVYDRALDMLANYQKQNDQCEIDDKVYLFVSELFGVNIPSLRQHVEGRYYYLQMIK